jgi:hypothetical protein
VRGSRLHRAAVWLGQAAEARREQPAARAPLARLSREAVAIARHGWDA